MIECTPGSDNGLNQSFFVQLFPTSAFNELVSSPSFDTSGPLLFSLSNHQVKEHTSNNRGRGSSNDQSKDDKNSIVRNSMSSVIPRFLVENLTPGLSYTAIIYSWNVKGRSAGHILKSIKLSLSPSEKRSSSVSTSSGSIMSNFDVSSDQESSDEDDNLFER